MEGTGGGRIERLLRAVEEGDRAARDELIEVLQPELRACASRMMRGQDRGHTLQATALVNEAYLKMFSRDHPHFSDRKHLLATAARAMRQILIDHARRKGRDKRHADGERTPLDNIALEYEGNGVDVLSLDEVLRDLATFDAEMARVAELRVFGGFSFEEIATIEDLSLRTLQRRWSSTKAWMASRLL